MPGDRNGEQRVVGRFLRVRGAEPLLHHLPVAERLSHLVLHVLLEAADDEARPEVLLRVVFGVGDGGGVQHVDEAREAARLAVVGGGREHDEGVGPPREQLREAAAQGARTPVGHVVRLVDDDDVPPRLFEVGAVLRILLEGVDGDDRLVVVVERVVVGGDPASYPLDADGIQARQGNGEAVPELLLKLRQHALDGEHEDAPPAPPGDELAHEDAGFERLSESYGVGDEDPLAGPGEGETSRIELIGDEVHGRGVPDMDVRVARYGLAKLALHVEDAVGELGRLVGNEPRVRRVEHLDGGLQRGQKDGFAPPYELGNPVADDLVSAGRVVHAADDPFRVAHDDPRAGGRDQGWPIRNRVHGDRRSPRQPRRREA